MPDNAPVSREPLGIADTLHDLVGGPDTPQPNEALDLAEIIDDAPAITALPRRQQLAEAAPAFDAPSIAGQPSAVDTPSDGTQIPQANARPLGIASALQADPSNSAGSTAGIPGAPANSPPLDLVDQLQREGGANGAIVGGFVITPAIEVGAAYDSNVFAASSGAKSDFYATEAPSLAIQSQWPQHAIALKAQGEFRQYVNQTSENVNNGTVALTGRLDTAPNAYILGTGSYQLLHEDRGALVAVSGTRPTQFTVVSGGVAFVLEPAPLGLRLDANAESYAYNNAVSASGQSINEAVRDRIVYSLAPRVSYEIVPNYDAFIGGVVNRRQYNSTRGSDGIDRSSAGYAADFGIGFHGMGGSAGEVYVGYLQQRYDSASVAGIHAVDFGVNLQWRPTPGTTARFNAGRSIEDSALPGAPGFLQTTARLTLESEIVTRTILNGALGFTKAEFPALSSSTDVYELGLGMRYLIVPGLSADLEYVVRHRTSMSTLPGYTRQIIGLRLRGQL